MEKNPVADWKIEQTWNNDEYVVNLHVSDDGGQWCIMKYDTLYEDWEEIEYFEYTKNANLVATMVFCQTILDTLGEIIYYAED